MALGMSLPSAFCSARSSSKRTLDDLRRSSAERSASTSATSSPRARWDARTRSGSSRSRRRSITPPGYRAAPHPRRDIPRHVILPVLGLFIPLRWEMGRGVKTGGEFLRIPGGGGRGAPAADFAAVGRGPFAAARGGFAVSVTRSSQCPRWGFSRSPCRVIHGVDKGSWAGLGGGSGSWLSPGSPWLSTGGGVSGILSTGCV